MPKDERSLLVICVQVPNQKNSAAEALNGKVRRVFVVLKHILKLVA